MRSAESVLFGAQPLEGQPELPGGRVLELPGRGTLFVRDTGPTHGPAVILLHGWTVSADLNWWPSYGPLAERFRVVSFDHRGHGHHGLRAAGPFDFAAVADDVVAVADALAIEKFIVAGYSMGGAIAQDVCRRHPSRVRGMVLAATASRFGSSPRARAEFLALRGLARAARSVPTLSDRVFARLTAWRLPSRGLSEWEQREIRACSALALLQAGEQLGRYDSRETLARIEVPHAVLVTTQDHIVDTAWQRELVDALPAPTVIELSTNHYVCTYEPDVFAPALVAACEAVLV